MAIFNPEPAKIADPDYTSASKGFFVAGDQSLDKYGTLIKGVGDLFSLGVDYADTIQKGKISEEAYARADPLRDPYRQLAQTEGTPEGPLDIRPPIQQEAMGGVVPQGVTQNLNRLIRLKRANESGRYTDTQYWHDLDTIARDLKNRYPGYTPYIDQVLSSITGSVPANALRRSVMAEMNALTGGDDIAKQRLQIAKEWFGKGYITEPMFTGFQNGTVPWETLASRGSSVAVENANVDLQINQLKLKQAQGTTEEKDILETGRATATQTVNSIIRNQSDSITLSNGMSLKKTIEQARANPQDISPAIITEMRQASAQAVFNARDAVRKKLSDPMFDSLTGSQKTDIENTSVGRLELMHDAIINKQNGIAAIPVNMAEDIANTDLAKVMSEDDILRRIALLRKITGGGSAFDLALLNSGAITEIQGRATNMVLANAMVGGKAGDTERMRTTQDILDGLQKTGKLNKKASQTVLDALFTTFADKNTSPKIRENIARTTFAGEFGGKKFIELFNPDSYPLIFTKVTSPNVVKAMEDVRTYAPDAYTDYVRWVGGNFRTFMKRDVDDIQGLVGDADVEVSWKPKSFEIDITPRRDISPERRALVDIGMPRYTPIKDRLNTALRGFANVVTSSGANPEDELYKALAQMGFDPNKEVPGYFENMFKGFSSWLEKMRLEEAKKKMRSEGNVK